MQMLHIKKQRKPSVHLLRCGPRILEYVRQLLSCTSGHNRAKGHRKYQDSSQPRPEDVKSRTYHSRCECVHRSEWTLLCDHTRVPMAKGLPLNVRFTVKDSQMLIIYTYIYIYIYIWAICYSLHFLANGIPLDRCLLPIIATTPQ